MKDLLPSIQREGRAGQGGIFNVLILALICGFLLLYGTLEWWLCFLGKIEKSSEIKLVSSGFASEEMFPVYLTYEIFHMMEEFSVFTLLVPGLKRI